MERRCCDGYDEDDCVQRVKVNKTSNCGRKACKRIATPEL